MRRWAWVLVLVAVLVAVSTAVAQAQDGPTQQQNESSSAQQQDVIINQSCEQGAVCNQQATVGGQEPAAPLQANVAAAAVPTPYPCLYFEAWDPVTESCFVKQEPAQSLGDDPVTAAPLAVLAFGLLIIPFAAMFLKKTW